MMDLLHHYAFRFKTIFFSLFFIIVIILFPSPGQPASIDYEVVFNGIEESILKTIKDSSTLIQSKDIPLQTAGSLINRAKKDESRFVKVLESYGYYSGKTTIKIGGIPLSSISSIAISSEEKQTVEITIEIGPQYIFDQIIIKGLTSAFLATVEMPLVKGEPAIPSKVLDTESLLLDQLKNKAHPYGSIKKRRVVIDTDKKTMDVHFNVSTGPWVQLGKLMLKGNKKVDSDFILKRVNWKEGDRYSPDIISDFKSSLTSLKVFSSIKVSIPYNLPKNAGKTITVPVRLKVKERKRKFVGVGANFSNINGGQAQVFWGHRNIFGEAERLKVTADVSRLGINEFSEINKNLEFDFLKPHFMRSQQDLLANSIVTVEKFDAFEREAISGSAGIKRQITPALSVTGSLAGEISKIEDSDGKEEFGLLSVPIILAYDTRKDLLNPRKGVRHEIQLDPYLTVLGPGDGFTVTALRSRAYWDILNSGIAVLAGRFVIGSIFAEEDINVPSDKRFYAGGGGSIRGYEFQKVGPLDDDNDPTGGRSLIEMSLEIRLRYKNFGIVPFIDGGNAFETETPDFDQEFQWGGGLGLRYYTNFGPLRLDLGFPINKRDIDEPWSFYVSIGQSF